MEFLCETSHHHENIDREDRTLSPS